VSITRLPIFERLRPFFDIQLCVQDGSQRNPRIRIEFKGLPPDLEAEALKLSMPCVACGGSIHPIRSRNSAPKRGWRDANLYYAATCPLAVNIGCSRGGRARDEYSLIKSIFMPELGGES
jgi:hypothetical protein